MTDIKMHFHLDRDRDLDWGQCWIATHSSEAPRTYHITTDEKFRLLAVRFLKGGGALIDTTKTAFDVFEQLEEAGWALCLARSLRIEVKG